MGKNLSQKFRSHGTPLGYLGPLFQRDVRLGSWNLQIPFIWGLVDPPGLVAPQVNAKTLKSVGSWCDLNDHQWAHGIEHRCVGGGLGHGNILWNYKSTPKKPANHGQRPFLMRCPVQSFRPFKLTREKSWKKCHGHWIQRNISTT